MIKYPITDDEVIKDLERLHQKVSQNIDDFCAPGDTLLVSLNQAIRCIKERKVLASDFTAC